MYKQNTFALSYVTLGQGTAIFWVQHVALSKNLLKDRIKDDILKKIRHR